MTQTREREKKKGFMIKLNILKLKLPLSLFRTLDIASEILSILIKS